MFQNRENLQTSKCCYKAQIPQKICVPPEPELTQDADEPGTTHKQVKPEKATKLSRLPALYCRECKHVLLTNLAFVQHVGEVWS